MKAKEPSSLHRLAAPAHNLNGARNQLSRLRRRRRRYLFNPLGRPPKENLSLQFMIKGNERTNERQITARRKVKVEGGTTNEDRTSVLKRTNKLVRPTTTNCLPLTHSLTRTLIQSHALHFRRHRVTAIIRSQKKKKNNLPGGQASDRDRQPRGAATTTTTPRRRGKIRLRRRWAAAGRRPSSTAAVGLSLMRVSRLQNYLKNTVYRHLSRCMMHL